MNLSERKSLIRLTASVEQLFSSTFTEPNPGLMAYFGRVKRGNDEEIRTPFANKQPLSQVIKDWERVYNNNYLPSKFESLHEFEYKMKDKVGPLSIMKPLKDRIPDIKNYYDDIKLEATPISIEAEDRVCRSLRSIANCRFLGIKNTIDDMKLSTNSGSPFFRKRRDVIDVSIPKSFSYITKDLAIVKLDQGDYLLGCVLGWRGQEGGIDIDDVKQRVIWMFPLSANIAELSCYKSIIRAGQSGLLPVWISNEAVDRRVTALFDTKSKDDYVVCTDFKRFDQHFNKHLQNSASHILRYVFRKEHLLDNWMKNVFPLKYNIPLWCSKDLVFLGDHGMASGSGGTNVDETLAHMCLQHESALLDSTELNPYSQCLGDDGILSYHKIDVDKLIKHYTSHGLVMEPSKQDVSRDSAIFLRRWHHTKYRVANVCVGVYSTFRALGRLCEQERFYDPKFWSNKSECLRYLAILENVKWHPLREQFADFVIERDKFSLGLGIPGFFDNLKSYAQNLFDQLPNFMSYTTSNMSREGVSGINEIGRAHV